MASAPSARNSADACFAMGCSAIRSYEPPYKTWKKFLILARDTLECGVLMPLRLTIRKPDDWHLHVRDGAMLKAVVVGRAGGDQGRGIGRAGADLSRRRDDRVARGGECRQRQVATGRSNVGL